MTNLHRLLVNSLIAAHLGLFPIGSGAALAQSESDAIVKPNAQLVSKGLQVRLAEADKNRPELESALARVPQKYRQGMEFLIENMPQQDLQTLSCEFLLEHVQLAYQARESAKWGSEIPVSVFLNQVLPYAVIDEPRDNVRRELREQFWPLVRDLDSISLAAARLNQKIFPELGVKYSTKRRVANQGPSETMESGLASCTGLSILLIDTYRACGIPARFAGVPMWTNNRGNHSWVEVWDGDWHFTGAAEPTGDELDKGWFVDQASRQKPGDRRYGIFATSFKRTSQKFPMAWSRYRQGAVSIYCEEVTERYQNRSKKLPDGFVELEFRTLKPTGFDRCRADLVLRDAEGKVVFSGQTHDESFDSNDHLKARVKQGTYRLELRTKSGSLVQDVVAEPTDQPITLRVAQEVTEGKGDSPILADLRQQLSRSVPLEEIANSKLGQQALTAAEAKEAKKLLVDHYQRIQRKARQAEHSAKALKLGDLEMKFEYKVFGEKPDAGRSLYISMHGGGGTAKRVNDGQWRNQQRLYQLEEGVYVAPRAPTDTWNLWHQSHIDPLFTRLIENMILFEDVNPDRVYITGYSAGGDGVFQLAPRMADQLAAAAMMAGHPNETKPDGLRNLPFTLHMGENDRAYDRNKKAQEWKKLLAELRVADPEGYEHWVEIHPGKGHWMDRQDAKGVAWLAQFSRVRNPKRVVWLQDDVTHSRFYWLAVAKEHQKARSRIVANQSGNEIEIAQCDTPAVSILLDDEWQDLESPIRVRYQNKILHEGEAKRELRHLITTLTDRGDPQAMYSGRLDLQVSTVN